MSIGEHSPRLSDVLILSVLLVKRQGKTAHKRGRKKTAHLLDLIKEQTAAGLRFARISIVST
jgi:hypothetical protein